MNEFLENIMNTTSELLAKGKNRFEIFIKEIQSTEFYSNLNDFEKKTIGMAALTPFSMFLLYDIMKKYNWEKKKKLVKSLVYNPDKASRNTFSKQRAQDIEKKLIFFEPRKEYKKSIKILEIIQDTYYEEHPREPQNVYPTDFALIYYNLKYPKYIPVSFDAHVNFKYRNWLKTKTRLLSDLLPVLRQNLDDFSCIYPSEIESGKKYMLDSNILISYNKKTDHGILSRQMFSEVIHDDTIELCVVPTVLEEIDFRANSHNRFSDHVVFYDKYKKNPEKYEKKNRRY